MKEYFKDVDCWIALLICSIIPVSIINHNSLINLAMLGLLGLAAVFRRTNAIFAYIAIMACFPLVLEDGSTLPFKMMDRIRLVYPIFLCILSFPMLKKDNLVKKYLFFCLFFLVLSVIWYVNVPKQEELFGIVNYMTMFLPIFILMYSSDIPLEKLFRVIDIIVLIAGVYAALEFFLRWNPYAEIAQFHGGEMGSYDISIVFRADGLMGNPIILSDLFLFEMCFLCLRSYITGKLNYLLFIIVAFLSMLTVSRTSTLGLLVVVLTWIFFSSRIEKGIPKKIIVAVALAFIILINFAEVAINFLFVRSSDMASESNILSRWSYYFGVFDLVYDHPFGVGSASLMDYIYKHYASLYSFMEMDTVDNVFLAQIGSYGIFGIITSYMWFYFYFYAKKVKANNTQLFYGIATISIMLLFVSFTHEWNDFVMPVILLSSSSALILRDMNMNIQSKFRKLLTSKF